MPRQRLGAKSKIDKESLKSYIAKNPNVTLQEVSREYGVSLWGIYYWLKKLNFSYKKKPSLTRKLVQEIEKNILKK